MPGTAATFEHLRTEPGLDDPDGFYAALIDLHKDLTPEQSNRANAKLILLLANHVGDRKALNEALAYVRADIEKNA